MFGLIPLPYRILIGVAFVGIVFSGGFATAWHIKSLSEQAALAKAATDALHIEQVQDARTLDISIETANQLTTLQTITIALIQKVTTYVSAQADAACTVPVGFVRLYNAASSMSALPDAAGVSDDAASGVALSSVADITVRAFGICNTEIDRLRELQKWINAQRAVVR